MRGVEINKSVCLPAALRELPLAILPIFFGTVSLSNSLQKFYCMGLLKKFHYFNSPFASGGILTAGCDDFGVFAGVFS